MAEAHIGKATFYRYFKDKYDVMNYNYKVLLDGYLLQCTNYRDLYCRLYEAAQAQLQPLVWSFHSTGVNSFENYIYTYSMGIVERITPSRAADLLYEMMPETLKYYWFKGE